MVKVITVGGGGVSDLPEGTALVEVTPEGGQTLRYYVPPAIIQRALDTGASITWDEAAVYHVWRNVLGGPLTGEVAHDWSMRFARDIF